MPTASVIVPARDAEETLPRALAAIREQELKGGFELIVVDNGSVDATPDIADTAGADLVVRRERGAGPGAARNAGAAASRAEVLAFIDADCWPAAGWLEAGAQALESADLIQGRVLPDPDVPAAPFDRTLAVTGAHGLFESANLFVRRELFLRLGGFPAGLERNGAPFGEDAAFGWSARRSGARTGFCADALVYHAIFARTAVEFMAERARLRMFPELAARFPELRETFFFRRWFHSPRSAAFDLAVTGCAAALVRRRALPLLATLPYARQIYRDARLWGLRQGPTLALAAVAADAVGAAALIRGGVAARSLVL